MSHLKSDINKIWFKKAISINISKFAKTADWTSLKLDADESDIDKLKTVCSYWFKNDVAKKTVFDELVIRLTPLILVDVLKNQYNTDKSSLEKKWCW